MSTITPTTSSTRPTGVQGRIAFETDTKNIIVYDGAFWRSYASDGSGGWSGINDYYLSFDGVDDYLSSSYGLDSPGSGDFSVSFWYKTSSIPTGTKVVFYAGDIQNTSTLQLNLRGSTDSSNPTKFRFYTADSSGQTIFDNYSNFQYTTNTWYHVTFVRSGTNLKVYIGDSTNSLSLQMNVTNNQLSQTFGGGYFLLSMFPSSNPIYWPTGSTYLPGLGDIDELAVFHSALTQSQITNIYKGESDGGSGGTNGTKGNLTSFDPVVWYRMGDGDEAGSGSTVYDMSANNYHATLYNSPSYTSY